MLVLGLVTLGAAASLSGEIRVIQPRLPQFEQLSEIGFDRNLHADGMWRHVDLPAVSDPEDGSASGFQVEEHSFWFQHRNILIQSLVQRFARKRVFFDVVGGNGCVTKGLQDAGTTAVLVEPGA